MLILGYFLHVIVCHFLVVVACGMNVGPSRMTKVNLMVFRGACMECIIPPFASILEISPSNFGRRQSEHDRTAFVTVVDQGVEAIHKSYAQCHLALVTRVKIRKGTSSAAPRL